MTEADKQAEVMAMNDSDLTTVQTLIDELMTIEDKSLPVIVLDEILILKGHKRIGMPYAVS